MFDFFENVKGLVLKDGDGYDSFLGVCKHRFLKRELHLGALCGRTQLSEFEVCLLRRFGTRSSNYTMLMLAWGLAMIDRTFAWRSQEFPDGTSSPRSSMETRAVHTEGTISTIPALSDRKELCLTQDSHLSCVAGCKKGLLVTLETARNGESSTQVSVSFSLSSSLSLRLCSSMESMRIHRECRSAHISLHLLQLVACAKLKC
jgi:hypothetical protein